MCNFVISSKKSFMASLSSRDDEDSEICVLTRLALTFF